MAGDAEAAEPLLRAMLEGAVVREVVSSQLAGALVSANAGEDVLTVCARLADQHVSSLPVFAADGSCSGIVDFSDAVAYLLKMDWEARGSFKIGTRVWEELGSVPVETAIDLSERNPKVTIPSSATLIEAMKVFREQQLRRALVTDPDSGKVVAVLSPSAIVQFITSELRGRSDVILGSSVADLKVGHSPVVSVNKNQALLEAMHLMHVTHHSVVAVVDPTTGALAGSVSMSDIKLVFQTKRFSLLVDTCWKYIVDARERSDAEVFPFFGVKSHDKLQMVISKLLATSVHHLYVVNDRSQPVEIISFSDVCTAIYDNC